MSRLALPVIVASGNPDKTREIVEIFVTLTGTPLVAAAMNAGNETFAFVVDAPESIAATIQALPAFDTAPDMEETGSTFVANARIKASAVASAAGALAIADDSGLEVDALGGEPGVHSARFAGAHGDATANIERLLRELGDRADRTARFVTVALAYWPDGRELSVRGEVEGTIAVAARGDGGFGYDPVFVPNEGDGRTFAEMTPEEKHAISHRGRAFRALAAALEGAV